MRKRSSKQRGSFRTRAIVACPSPTHQVLAAIVALVLIVQRGFHPIAKGDWPLAQDQIREAFSQGLTKKAGFSHLSEKQFEAIGDNISWSRCTTLNARRRRAFRVAEEMMAT